MIQTGSSIFHRHGPHTLRDLTYADMVGAPAYSFFVIPVAHFPWSETGMKRRGKKDEKATA